MSYGHYDPRALALAFATQDLHNAQARAIKTAMTPRQMLLNYRYSFYAGEQYENRVVAWNGLKVLEPIEREGVFRAPTLIPGFVDRAGLLELTPLEYRKPDVVQHTVAEVVNGFTDLMFGEGQTPTLSIAGDDDGTKWVADMIESCSYWQRWLHARNLAGAMGAVGMSFKFVQGRLIIEVHDPRWCKPTIIDQSTGDCSSMEIRYMYPVEAVDKNGGPIEVWHWYRRVIDAKADTTYQPVVVDDKEPLWTPDPARTITHELGIFPGVWVQNTEAPGRLEGEPDCKGIYDNAETFDRLVTQAASGAVHNADPTLHVATDDRKLEDVRKGSKNALRTEKGGAAAYVEMSGGGTDAALRVAEIVDKINLRATRYVRLEDYAGQMTAEEVRRRFGPMISAVSTKRTHWTQTAIIPMTEKIIRVTRQLSERRTDDPHTGTIIVTTVEGSPLPASLQSGQVENQSIVAAGVTLKAKWPPVIKASTTDAQTAAGAASVARASRILDTESAVRYIAPMFGIEDVEGVLDRVQAEGNAQAAALESELLAGAGGAPMPDGAPEKAADEALNGAQIEALKAMAADSYNGAMPRASVLAQARLAFPAANPQMLEAAIPEPRTTPAMVASGLPGTPPAPIRPPDPRGSSPRSTLGVGQAVKVKPGQEHDPSHTGITMTIAEIRDGAIALTMPDGTRHEWYAPDELVST